MSEEASQSILTDGEFLDRRSWTKRTNARRSTRSVVELWGRRTENKEICREQTQVPSWCKLCGQKWPITLQRQQRNHIIAELKDTEIRGVNQEANGTQRESRHQETISSLNSKIQKSEESIKKLKAHKEKGTCPVSLRYNVRANITPDESSNRSSVNEGKRPNKSFLRH